MCDPAVFFIHHLGRYFKHIGKLVEFSPQNRGKRAKNWGFLAEEIT